MDIIGTAYDKIQEYYSPDSDYVQSVTTGWFDSNGDDPFSNEQMKAENRRSQKLVFFPRWHCIDNHKLYKWFFKDVGLYEKTNFIDGSGG